MENIKYEKLKFQYTGRLNTIKDAISKFNVVGSRYLSVASGNSDWDVVTHKDDPMLSQFLLTFKGHKEYDGKSYSSVLPSGGIDIYRYTHVDVIVLENEKVMHELLDAYAFIKATYTTAELSNKAFRIEALQARLYKLRGWTLNYVPAHDGGPLRVSPLPNNKMLHDRIVSLEALVNELKKDRKDA